MDSNNTWFSISYNKFNNRHNSIQKKYIMKQKIKHNKMHPNKINRAIYKVRLTHNLKKCSDAELQLTMVCLTQEIQRRKEHK